MTHLVVCDWDATNRITACRNEATEQDAIAAVARVAAEYPNAFYVVAPAGDPHDYIANPAAGTVTADPLPPPGMTDDTAYDALVAQDDLLAKYLKMVVKKLNNGTFVPGGNLTNAQLKDLFKAGMGSA